MPSSTSVIAFIAASDDIPLRAQFRWHALEREDQSGLHPAMLLRFRDGTSLQQHGNRPTAVLAVRGFGDVENGSSVCRSRMPCSIEKPLYRLSAHG
jgi:hypothetical protein